MGLVVEGNCATNLVMLSPALDEYLSLSYLERFPVEEFISEFAVEGFVAILPRTPSSIKGVLTWAA